MKHRIVTIGVAATLAAAALVVPATPALAATCWRSSCLGKDPQATGCANDGTTIAQASLDGTIFIRVRYSATCGAYWANSQISEPSAPTYNEAILYGWNSTASYTEDSGVHDSYTVWSNMIPTGFWVQACNNAWIYDQRMCTDVVGSGSGPM